MNVFDRYAPFIQDFIYQNSWESLRAVQVAAGDAVSNTDCNVLLCASTASGKTEAAFFPILTLFTEDMPSSVGAIYIGPLKALINDQFMRLNDLCREADIPVWHWHGDVSQSHKNKLLKNPSGILQITPESLEALLLHKHSYVARLFGDLRFIVIDEVHSLMRGDRGDPLSYRAADAPLRLKAEDNRALRHRGRPREHGAAALRMLGQAHRDTQDRGGRGQVAALNGAFLY